MPPVRRCCFPACSTWWLVSFYVDAGNVQIPKAVHSIFTTSRPPWTFHALVLVTVPRVPGRKREPVSHMWHGCHATPVFHSYLKPDRRPCPHSSFNHFSLTVGIYFCFPSKQRVIATFHSGFDLPFLYLCIYKTDPINDYPFHLRCQLVKHEFHRPWSNGSSLSLLIRLT